MRCDSLPSDPPSPSSPSSPPADLAVPALRMMVDTGTPVAVVTRWGRVGHLDLRPSDRVVTASAAGASDDRLLLLAPRGRGFPMIGRRERGRLLAEPGGVPASEARWAVLGQVAWIERPVERSVAPAGAWYVATATEDPASGSHVVPPAQGPMSAADLDALCLRAALAPDRDGRRVALAAARDPQVAAALAEGAPWGVIRFDAGIPDQPEPRRVIVGPWQPWSLEPSDRSAAPAPAPRPEPRVTGVGRGAVQLGLFGDRARGGSRARNA